MVSLVGSSVSSAVSNPIIDLFVWLLLHVTPFQPGSRAVVDAGMKAVSMDSGVPLVSDDD